MEEIKIIPTETSRPENKPDYAVTFHGSNLDYFKISIYNLLLTIVTLGLYYPWAKCAIRKYLWQETEVAGSRFEWHGTGKEMFKGFIKAYLILGGIFVIIQFGPMFIPAEYVVFSILGSYLILLLFFPLAIHGMARYRLSRTSLRGIHFGYRGNLKKFYGKTILDFILVIFTLGVYNSWFRVNIRKYVMKHARFGNVKFGFKGSGGELFGLTIVQFLLMNITLFIYTPWAIIEFFKFYLRKSVVIQNDKEHYFRTKAKGGEYFVVLIKSALITVFTFGIGFPIGQIMRHRYLVNTISLDGRFDFDQIQQTEESYKDATGDDMGDLLDIDF